MGWLISPYADAPEAHEDPYVDAFEMNDSDDEGEIYRAAASPACLTIGFLNHTPSWMLIPRRWRGPQDKQAAAMLLIARHRNPKYYVLAMTVMTSLA